MRKPDLIIGPASDPQTLRWHIFRWRGWQLALHKWCRSDDDRALHDHSGDNISIILSRQGYIEIVQYREDERSIEWTGRSITVTHRRRCFVPYFRRAETPHRIALADDQPVWTLWLRWPPRRDWGFHCPRGWRHWRDYIATKTGDYYADGESVTGRGCD